MSLAELDDEPSFALSREQTSTPQRGAAYSGAQTRREDQYGNAGGDEGPLHESDTESVPDDRDRNRNRDGLKAEEQEGNTSGGRSTPLTRRSLLQLARDVDHQDHKQVAAVDPVPADSKGNLEALRREHLYAPSPSTGSSTLVDHDLPVYKSRAAAAAGFASLPSAARPSPPRQPAESQHIYNHNFGDEALTSGSDSTAPAPSERPPRRNRIGDLASFVDSRLSARAPPPSEDLSSLSRRQSRRGSRSPAAGAPLAAIDPPDAASSPRERRMRTSERSYRNDDHPPLSAGSHQVHDVFRRLITGPEGALAHSAERRAAAASSPGEAPSVLSASVPAYASRRYDSPAPAPMGQYTFVPSSSLPVQRPAPAPALQREERETGREGSSQLERALHHLSEAQRREMSAGQDDPLSDRAVRVPSPRARGDAGGYRFEERTLPEGRSAIQYAMAETSAFSHTDEDEADDGGRHRGFPPSRSPPDNRSHLRNSVRFAAEPTYHLQSPSRSPSPPRQPDSPPQLSLGQQSGFAGPRAFPRAKSPDLPPLPLPLPPESPDPVRIATVSRTRSPANRFRRLQTLPPERDLTPEDRPVQAVPSPSPSSSPPRRSRRSGWERPASSTPPRRGGAFELPRPQLTPEDRPDLSLSTARSTRRSGYGSPPAAASAGAPIWADGLEEEEEQEQEEEGPGEVPPLRFEASPRSAEADDSTTSVKIRELVSQLSAAVQTLAEHESPARRAKEGTPTAAAAGKGDLAQGARRVNELAGQLRHRKELNERRRQELERELNGMEQQTVSQTVRSLSSWSGSAGRVLIGAWRMQHDRSETLKRLVETYELEHDLGCRMDELKRSIEGMSELVGSQVSLRLPVGARSMAAALVAHIGALLE